MRSVLDSQLNGRGFDSRSGCGCLTNLGKLLTPMCLPLSVMLSVTGKDVGLAESNGCLPPSLWLLMTSQGENQLQNATLVSSVG